MVNPYCWNRININLIFGRSALLSEMLTQLPSMSGNSFGLTGARRMGKTTILRAIESDLKNGSGIWKSSGTHLIPIYIDGLSLPRPLDAGFLWKEILGRIQSELAISGEHQTDVNGPVDFYDFVASTKNLLSRSEQVPHVIVIFDEIEHILVTDWAASFFANWRALLSNTPDVSNYFSAVFSGARELEELQHDIGSPLMDILEWRSLRSLSYKDTSELIREPTNLDVEDSVIDLIFENTGGHPMVIQYVMQEILNDSASITLFEKAGKAITNFESRRSWQFSDWWYKYCIEESRTVYSRLPRDFKNTEVSVISTEFGSYSTAKALEILQHVGLVEVSESGDSIRRRGSMFSRWQIQQGRSTDGIAVDSNLAEMLGKLKNEMRDKYISAWAIYSTDMPNYSGAVSEMRDTITMVLHELAPDTNVEAQPNFKFEPDLTKPTRRQRVMYIFGVKGKEQAKSVASDDELLATLASQVSVAVASTYSNASALTHTTATRPLAYRSLKQGESILVQLLSQRA
jgi:Predicted pPIWI-associating nuclease